MHHRCRNTEIFYRNINNTKKSKSSTFIKSRRTLAKCTQRIKSEFIVYVFNMQSNQMTYTIVSLKQCTMALLLCSFIKPNRLISALFSIHDAAASTIVTTLCLFHIFPARDQALVLCLAVYMLTAVESVMFFLAAFPLLP